MKQTFIAPGDREWVQITSLPGVELLPLAQPVSDGSIHRARLARGAEIPVHTHPSDEFVLVLAGFVTAHREWWEARVRVARWRRLWEVRELKARST